MFSDPLLMRHIEKLIENAQTPSPALQRLPHPARLDALGFDEVLRAILGDSRYWLDDALCDAAIPIDEIMYLASRDPQFAQMQQAYAHDAYNQNAGSLRSQMVYLRYKALGGTLFQTTDALESMLDNAAISDGVLAEYLRPPFPACYIAFGDHAAHDNLQLTDTLGENYPLEGMYVLEDVRPIDPDDPAQPPVLKVLHGHRRGELVRTLSLVACGSPEGRAHPLDDYVQVYSLDVPLSSAEIPLTELLDAQTQAHNQAAKKSGAAPVSKLHEEQMRRAVDHLVRVLLYLNLRAQRTEAVPERTLWLERVARAEGGKRKRLERRAQALYDRVEVGPERLPDELDRAQQDARGENAGVRPHWRRGHFHTVRFGPGHSRRRLEFFAPTLVGADRLDGEAPAAGQYRVR